MSNSPSSQSSTPLELSYSHTSSESTTSQYAYMDDYSYYRSGTPPGSTPVRSATTLSTASTASTTSTMSAATLSSSASKGPTKKNVNVYTTCGRHSNEWLFSGWSFSLRRHKR